MSVRDSLREDTEAKPNSGQRIPNLSGQWNKHRTQTCRRIQSTWRCPPLRKKYESLMRTESGVSGSVKMLSSGISGVLNSPGRSGLPRVCATSWIQEDIWVLKGWQVSGTNDHLYYYPFGPLGIKKALKPWTNSSLEHVIRSSKPNHDALLTPVTRIPKWYEPSFLGDWQMSLS